MGINVSLFQRKLKCFVTKRFACNLDHLQLLFDDLVFELIIFDISGEGHFDESLLTLNSKMD